MRILQISSAKNFGGGEKHLIDLCEGLQKRGHEIFLLTRPSIKWKEKLEFLPEEKIIFASIRNSVDIFCLPKIIRIIKQHQIELLHAHVARDYLIAALASFLSQTPLVLTRHLTYKLKFLHRLTFRQVSKVIAVSNGVAESLLKNKTVAGRKVEVIYNGVDLETFAAKEL